MIENRERPLLRVGVIGTGKHGSRYVRHLLNDVPGLTLQAVCRRSEEGRRQAASWRCRYYRDWHEMVAHPDVDGVIAAAPPTINRDIAIACTREGKPLLLEKPLAGCLADAEYIVNLARQEGLRLTTGQTLRYNAVIKKMKSELDGLGSLYTFSANQHLEPASLQWLQLPEIAGAGVSFHTAVHVFDALRCITGLEVVRLTALSRCHGNASLEDVLLVLLEMENGVVGTVDCSKVGSARSGLFHFVGANGQLWGEQVYNTVTLVEGQQQKDISPARPVNTIVPLLEDWAAYVQGEGENPVPGDEGLAAVRICDACLKAARDGSWVTLNA